MPTSTLPRGRVQRSRPRVLRRLALTVGVVVVAVVAAVVVTARTVHPVASAACTVTTDGGSVDLEPDQAVNVATIADVAVARGLPDHAVTVALATARQESKWINLPGGDRDSIGLFQQRPSQGWGTAAQVSDPVYASGAFYSALVKLPHWQTDPVAVAAQAVQRSADGSAYAQWESVARPLAVALTGERVQTFTCHGGALSRGTARTTTTSAAVAADVRSALGASALSPGADTQLGRAAAARLVARSQRDAITAVAYGGQRWSALTGRWSADATAGSTVTFTLAPVATA